MNDIIDFDVDDDEEEGSNSTTLIPHSKRLATTEVKPFDPAELGFPPMLPFELAMRNAPASEVCAAYNIDKDEFIRLTQDPLFATAYANAREALQKDGMSFRVKAKIQAEQLLKKSWAMIHSDATPTAVKSDLIKATIRWAGYEPKGDGPGAGGANAFQININLG
jgi:hypothetical protein